MSIVKPFAITGQAGADVFEDQQFSIQVDGIGASGGERFQNLTGTTLNINNDDGISLSIWFRTVGTSPPGNIAIWEIGAAATPNAMNIFQTTSTWQFRFYAANGTSTRAGNFGTQVDDAWTHLVVTYSIPSGSSIVDAYENGSPASINFVTFANPDLVTDARLFRFAQLDGRVFSMAIHNTVLTSDEVSTIYNGGDPNFDLMENSGDYVSSGNLIKWWRCGLEKNQADWGKEFVSGGSGSNLSDDISGDVTRVEDAPTP